MSGLDIDPRKPLPCRLVALLRVANHTIDDLKRHLDEAEETAQCLRESQLYLRREHNRLKDLYLCKSCQNHVASTPQGDTICLCTSCSGRQKSVQSLRFENTLLRSELQKYQGDKALLYFGRDDDDEVIAKNEGDTDGTCGTMADVTRTLQGDRS